MRQGCRQFKIGESTGFICGGEPTDHKCNEDAVVFELQLGERIFLKDGDNKRYYDKHYREIRSVSVACSICGRTVMDNVWYL